MADSTQILAPINLFLQKRMASRYVNTLHQMMPTLEMFTALNKGTKTTPFGPGIPGSAPLMIGRINEMGKINREKVLKEREYRPLVKYAKPPKGDVKKMGDFDTTATASAWDVNHPLGRFKQPRFKFARRQMPYSIPHTDLREFGHSGTNDGRATADAITSVYDLEVKDRANVLSEVLNDNLWAINGETGIPTDEDAKQWDQFHSIQQAMALTNTYGGIDRSLAQNSWWVSNDSNTNFDGSFEQLIEYTDYDLSMLTYGMGVGCIAVGKSLIKKAKAEARVKQWNIYTNGIPEFAEFGFKRDIVVVNSGNRKVYIYYDPSVDAIDTAAASAPYYNAFCFDPKTWTVIIPPDGDYKVSGPYDQTKVKGGAEEDTGTINVELLICCEVPKGNARFRKVRA